jgi:Xaa-Pro aminopeptidase
MNPIFTSEFFINNRTRLKQTAETTAPVVITANGLLQSGGDTSYPFNQDASFWYLTGCDMPDVILVCHPDGDYLIVPSRAGSRVDFDGQIDHQRLAKVSGIKLILDETKGWQLLNDQLNKAKQVATLVAAPVYIKAFGMYTNPARQTLIEKLKLNRRQFNVLDLTREIAQLRVIKQPTEIIAIQKAVDITIASLEHIQKRAKAGAYHFEYEVEAELNRDFRRLGGRGHAFAPIVAGGIRACTLHNVQNDGQLQPSELLLCDVGADYQHYAADLTRTFSIGVPTNRQQALYAAVLETQVFALAILKPGVLLKEYEQKVRQFLGIKLRELGLITIVNQKNISRYLPHAVSHYLGLNTHDIGFYSEPLKPGMVLTVEPGIYVPKEAIGIRIEDDVLITETGNRVLSSHLSHGLS